MRYRPTGFSLIELLIVLGLVGVIGTFDVVMSLSSVARSSVQTERDLFVTLLLRGARAEAVANVDQTAHGVYIDNACDRYILFEGTSFTPPGNCNPNNRAVPYSDTSLSVTNAGGDTIIFAQRSGNIITGTGSAPTSTIFISNGVATQTININRVGQIDW